MAKKVERPVVVTTKHRGVFFGYAVDTSGDRVTLSRVRNCIYWGSSVGGFLGLASKGPNQDCRIGAQAPTADIRDVTAVLEVEQTAAAAWESAKVYGQ